MENSLRNVLSTLETLENVFVLFGENEYSAEGLISEFSPLLRFFVSTVDKIDRNRTIITVY